MGNDRDSQIKQKNDQKLKVKKKLNQDQTNRYTESQNI